MSIVTCIFLFQCSFKIDKILATSTVCVCMFVCVGNMSVKIVDFLMLLLCRLRRILPAVSSRRGNEL